MALNDDPAEGPPTRLAAYAVSLAGIALFAGVLLLLVLRH